MPKIIIHWVLTSIMANTCIQVVWMGSSTLQKCWRRHTQTHEREGHFVIKLNTHTLMENESVTWHNKCPLTTFCSDAYGEYADDQRFWSTSTHVLSMYSSLQPPKGNLILVLQSRLLSSRMWHCVVWAYQHFKGTCRWHFQGKSLNIGELLPDHTA